MSQIDAIRSCIDAIGGQPETAIYLGVSRAFVNNVYAGRKKIPIDKAIKLIGRARAAGVEVTLHELLPDEYPLAARPYILPPDAPAERVPLGGGRKRKGEA